MFMRILYKYLFLRNKLIDKNILLKFLFNIKIFIYSNIFFPIKIFKMNHITIEIMEEFALFINNLECNLTLEYSNNKYKLYNDNIYYMNIYICDSLNEYLYIHFYSNNFKIIINKNDPYIDIQIKRNLTDTYHIACCNSIDRSETYIKKDIEYINNEMKKLFLSLGKKYLNQLKFGR